MAKYVIEDTDKEIAELRNKCKIVRDRISRIGIMLPPIKIKEAVLSNIHTVRSDDYLPDIENEIDPIIKPISQSKVRFDKTRLG